MPQWFADSRLTFDDLRRARKGLLDSTDGLAVMPLHNRLWHGHLYWLVKLAKIETSPASGECFDAVSVRLLLFAPLKRVWARLSAITLFSS